MGPHPNIVCSRQRLSSHQPYQQGTDLPEGPCVPSVFPVQSLVALVAVLPVSRWQVPFAKCWSAAKAREAYKDGPSVIFRRWSSTSTCGKLMAKKEGLPSGND